MPASSPGREQANRDEILEAAERLYGEKDFRDISLNDIAKLTTLSRPSIYNYFQSKEEIFLALLDREHKLWTSSLERIDAGKADTPRKFAGAVARTLEQRTLMLKILVANLYGLENNSSMDALVAFKLTYWESVNAMKRVTARCLPGMSRSRINSFVELFFPFVFGIYPYTFHSQKQKEAMEAAGVYMKEPTIRNLATAGIERLLGE